MPTGILIRRATEQDIPDLVRLRIALMKDLDRFPTGADITAFASSVHHYLDHALPAQTYIAWIAETNGAIVACVGAELHIRMPHPRNPQGREFYMINVYTEPEYRRLGLAEQLVRCAIDFARENAFPMIVLHATPQGRPLYTKLGFQPGTNEMILHLR